MTERMHSSIGLVLIAAGALFLLSAGGASGQDFSLPVRWCVVGDDANDNGVADAGEAGAPAFTDPGLVGEPDTDSVLWRRHERISDRTYIPQAGVTFRSALFNIVEDTTLRFPIIPDPDTSDPDHQIGDLLSSPANERDLARDACIEAWRNDHEVRDMGIIAIVARRLVDADGEAVANGVGRRGQRLLWVQDNAFVLPDPTPEGDLRDPFDGTFGHELGHALPAALRHTIDDDSNIMRSSPADIDSDGVRDNFDLSTSIEDETGATVDQIALVADTAPDVPGCKIFGTNTNCSTRSDAHTDPRGDIGEEFLDLRVVSLANRDGISTEIIHEVAGPFNNDFFNFESVDFFAFLDLDGNPETGGPPADLGLDTVFQGAEIVTRVRVSPFVLESKHTPVSAAGQPSPPALTTQATLWRFEGTSFSEVSEPGIVSILIPLIDIIDPIRPGGQSLEELVGHSISVQFPDDIHSVISETPRLQALSRGVMIDEEFVDRLDDSPEETGVFYRLVFPTFPLCEASPNPVQAGMDFEIAASGLLPNAAVKVFLGDEKIGEAQTDGGGALDDEFTVPLSARVGKRLLTVGVVGTGLTADCPVTVEEPEEIPPAADLKVTKSCIPRLPIAGKETANCTIYVSNLGPSLASNVILTDALVSDDTGAIEEVDLHLTSSQGTCRIVTGETLTIECELGDLAVGKQARLTYDLKALWPIDLKNAALAQSSTPDPDPSNNENQESLSFIRDHDAD